MNKQDTWDSGDPYEYFMGRWSKLMAPVFLEWLSFPDNKSWLDIGCGTGALSNAIFHFNKPSALCCIDPSAGFLEKAKGRLHGNIDFAVGDASDIPKAKGSFDIVVSGLALNFFPDLPRALSEMKRVLKPGGAIAAYVWDYAGRMDFLRLFWEAAGQIDLAAQNLDEGVRFPICNTARLEHAFQEAGLTGVETSCLDIDTVFKDFEDYWQPFLGGQGPAPGYLASLSSEKQEELKDIVRNKLPMEADGSIRLMARALAVKGII